MLINKIIHSNVMVLTNPVQLNTVRNHSNKSSQEVIYGKGL
jgi:hypothetical protein